MNIDDLTYIGVCDGHGDFGHYISDYLIKNLPNNFLNSYINLKQEINEQYNKISKEKITKIFEESFSKTMCKSSFTKKKFIYSFYSKCR